VFPSEMLVMMNVVVDFKNHHRYSDVEYLDTVQTEMKNFLMERVGAVVVGCSAGRSCCFHC